MVRDIGLVEYIDCRFWLGVVGSSLILDVFYMNLVFEIYLFSRKLGELVIIGK